MSKPSKQVCSKGDTVICPNGHEIYEVLTDIYVGDLLKSSDFKGLHGHPDPTPYDAAICPVCQAHLFKNLKRGFLF
jgi:hypothetical protein